PAVQEAMETDLGDVSAKAEVVSALGPAKVFQDRAYRRVPALGVIGQEGLDSGSRGSGGEERGRQHGANIDRPPVGACLWVKRGILIREERHQGGLEPEANFVAHIGADAPAPGSRPLVAIRNLTADQTAKRARRQIGIGIIQEIRRSAEMRVMI